MILLVLAHGDKKILKPRRKNLPAFKKILKKKSD